MARRNIRKAVIPAAGLGTRFLPATKAQPKEMLPIIDRPAIQYIVEEAVQAGIDDIIIITGQGKRAIEDHFDRSPALEHRLRSTGSWDHLRMVQNLANLADIHFVRQTEPLGLGHAVYLARRHVGNEPFALLLGDDIVRAPLPGIRQLIDQYARRPGTVVAVEEVPDDQVHRYGIIRGRSVPGVPNLYEVEELVEKPSPAQAPSRLGIVGRYVLEPEIFAALRDLPPGVGGEFQLTDGLRRLARHRPMHALRLSGRRYDIGDPVGFLKANVELALADPDLGGDVLRYIQGLLEERAEVTLA